MVHQREGGGKISSPYSVKYFGDQKPPKMGRCDPNWIIILLVIYLDAFGVENVDESSQGIVFTGGTHFGKMRSKTFQQHFEASNEVF